MATNFKDEPIHEYMVSKVALNEEGYNYYLYVHPLGQVVVLREKTDGTEYLYADGGRSKTSAWANRVTLNYKYYDQIG